MSMEPLVGLHEPKRSIRIGILGVLLATPTVLLVAGALLLGFSLDGENVNVNGESGNLITVVEPQLGIGSDYQNKSLIKSVPQNWEQQRARLGPPIMVTIREIEMYSSVIQVSAYSGVMEIPEDISKVGWFVGSAAPGQTNGSAVLVGHRDGVEGGRGAFYGIEKLNHGDQIMVTTSGGSRLHYSVIEVDVVDKDRIPEIADFVFATNGDPRLTLITCGGAYDSEDGGYQANVIVTAVPM
jgi:LPXTG-site transpeptidase (sortase) family protein